MTTSGGRDFASNKLFHGAPSAILDCLERGCEPVVFEAGDVIFEEDDPAEHLYLIASGSVVISKRGRGGEQETLSHLEPGDFFGEMALYTGEDRSARVTAVRETRLGRIDRPGLEELFQTAPLELSRNLIGEVLTRLRHTDSRFIRQVLEAERLGLVGSMTATIVHDFKTPMSTILGAADLVEEFSDDDRLLRFVGMIRRSIDRMLVMTRELLDYSRGVSTLELEEVAIGELMAELDEQALALLSDKGIRVERRVSYGGDLVIDRGRFVRVLLNLVKNAVEAMPEGGELTVSVETSEDRIMFGIADTGHGIPEELLPAIFEPFVTHGKAQGTGLGMAIVKSIVDAHQGSVHVDSTPGVGTHFEVVIPKSPSAPA